MGKSANTLNRTVFVSAVHINLRNKCLNPLVDKPAAWGETEDWAFPQVFDVETNQPVS